MTQAQWQPAAVAAVLVLGCSGATVAPSNDRVKPNPTGSATSVIDAGPNVAPTANELSADAGASVNEPPSKYARCEQPPKGMVCIAGGPTIVGSNDHQRNEKPRHSVEVSTFYIDQYEVTNREYEKCEKAGECKKNRQILSGWGNFLGSDQPAIAVTWEHADAYCRWAGKRLPSEAEWEKVARGATEGRLYPWGSDPPTCDRAHTAGCTPNTTKQVGSLPAGPYGVFDMAGNGYEWVNDWATPCYSGCPGECGKHCTGLDPQGPCGGAPYCGRLKHRILKGGSWYWSAEHARGSWRRPERPKSGMHRLSVRCASTGPQLATWPPLAITDPLPRPADPSPPSAEQLAIFHDLTEDQDIHKVPLCAEGRGAKIDCREAFSYVTSNEPSQQLWMPFIKNLGGGYTGIGSDQAYNFISAARSRWAWLFDYDPLVVRTHYIIRAVVLAEDTPAKFVAAFTPGRSAQTRTLVRASLKQHPAEQKATDAAYDRIRKAVYQTYQASLKPNPEKKGLGWLRYPDNYRYVRLMFQQRRIAIIKGNLLTDKAMPSIARSARRLGVPIRIFYVSNADEQWAIPQQYRNNITALPFDQRSVVLRTYVPRWRKRVVGQEPWDYIAQAGIEEQRLVVHPGWKWTWWFAKNARRVSPYLLVSGLPARTAR